MADWLSLVNSRGVVGHCDLQHPGERGPKKQPSSRHHREWLIEQIGKFAHNTFLFSAVNGCPCGIQEY